ncbi:hypothetical protein HUJ04_000016 [Dendroctonus ponderosae]|nr:hypothetical protein HUJ04_000016 [Dendroctonus ponderosae]
MEGQNQEMMAGGSPAEVPNDPGKMFIGGLSWQTSPGESPAALTAEESFTRLFTRPINALKHVALLSIYLSIYASVHSNAAGWCTHSFEFSRALRAERPSTPQVAPPVLPRGRGFYHSLGRRKPPLIDPDPPAWIYGSHLAR